MSTAERSAAWRCFERGDELARYEKVSGGDSEEDDRGEKKIFLMTVVKKKLDNLSLGGIFHAKKDELNNLRIRFLKINFKFK